MSASEHVWALVSGLPKREREKRWFVVLQAFIDDSGSEPQSEYFALGGFVAPVMRWIDFSEEWQVVLDQSPQLDYFKMTEAHNLRGQFDRRKGWTEAKRDSRVLDFAFVIKTFASLRISTAIRNQDFKSHIESLAVPERKLTSDNPYILLFTHLITNMSAFISLFAPHEKCKFIFDEQIGYDNEILLWWPQFKHIAATSTGTDFASFIGDRPYFEKEGDFLPLQAGDMYAWQVRNLRQMSSRKIIVPPTMVMRTLASMPQWDLMINEWAVKDLRNHLLTKSNEFVAANPGVKLVHSDKRARKTARRRRKKIIGV